MEHNIKLSFILLASLLGGCTYSTEFDCPAGEGLKCTSLSKVNRKMDKGEIDLGLDPEPMTRPLSPSLDIYFGPHIDEEGYYHSEKLLYVPMKGQP
jgi:hypothetical protein